MSLAMCKAFSALSFWKATTVRAFSSSLVQYTNADHTNNIIEVRSLTDKEEEAKEPARKYQDLALRDQQAMSHQRWYQRKRDKDPTFMERRRECSRVYVRKVSLQAHYRFRRKVMKWTKHSWVRQLPWKTHTPIFTQDKVRQICATCGSYRIDGAKLWWQRHVPSDPPLYDCQTCFAKTGIMPDGYEDVKTFGELKARKEELDNSTKDLSDSEHDKHKG
ncbi:hypothetical protein M436DRAFT_65386 [Aureobasidium namibiae CBS 147.97]|uniref:Uncharacterized protein n=1 Tax=Aureobasidium namibiae CBS 147.97 TaxID=1043004 RepID=A0A074WDZ9_9PEZI|nr:uncharacterized protein M436DRAFT_65386 [Aureobasidium namibiae CBS 147.97]KEQ71228.1 hypothetical protein M436DRAFT_65386 [Aureobasidium namibiae CBS 147.97]